MSICICKPNRKSKYCPAHMGFQIRPSKKSRSFVLKHLQMDSDYNNDGVAGEGVGRSLDKQGKQAQH